MTLVVTHVLPETGSEFHEQKLYHVPRETARQIASDFETFQEKRLAGEKRSDKEERRDGDARAPATNTYDYSLGAPEPTENDEARDATAAPDQVSSSEDHDARGPEDARGQGGDGEEGPGEQPRGLLSIDFRTVAAIQAYDRLS